LIADPNAAAAVLVRASRNGDRSAFGRLYALYSRMVHAIAIARVGPADADDIVQDVFLTAMKQLHALRDESAFGGWLATIARNRANGHLRGGQANVPLPDDEEQAALPVLHATQEDEREARHALATICTLSEAYRETLMMRLVEGMTGPEIAERTGLTPESVRVNLHRGMKLLREALERGRAR
jgi:RNA polymerase sigma-70 factor (ECF subfamily)